MRTRPGSIAMVVVVVAALLLVVIGAAVRGPWVNSPDSALEAASDPQPTVQVSPPASLAPNPNDKLRDQWDASWLPAALTVVAIITAAALLFSLIRMLLRAIGRARLPQPAAEAVRGGDLVTAVDLPRVDALRKGVESAQTSLESNREPGDAVIAAWLALEHAAEQSGVARNRAETPTEFTVSVLGRTEADPASTQQLLDLYLVARFSTHPITDADVSRAGECLTRIAESMDLDSATLETSTTPAAP